MNLGRLQFLFNRIGPVRITFLTSLLLSWVAIQGKLVNRDGIYYLDTARTIVEEGLGAVMRVGEWNFFPLLIAVFSAVTPLGLETAAKVLNALFLAGTCALLVDWVRKRFPEAVWITLLVVLAMPAFNNYRNQILREYGFWFFSVLGFWLAMRWDDSRTWRDVLLSQLALLAAAFFRLEAVAFFAALTLWQAFAATPGNRMRSALSVSVLPIGLLSLGVLLVTAGAVPLPGRIEYYLTAANPLHKATIFADAAGRLSDIVLLNKYSREEAIYILLAGLLAIIPIKFIKLMSFLVIPFAYSFKGESLRKALQPWQPLPWAFALYILVLAAFVTHQMFLSGRYVSMLNLLAIPLVAVGLLHLIKHFPRWKLAMVLLALTMIAANVISISPRQTHVLEAATWLKQHVNETNHVGMETSRLAYYAGWKLSQSTFQDRETLATELSKHHLDMAAFEVDHREGEIRVWLEKNELLELKRFTGPKGDAVVLAVPKGD